MKKRIYHRLKMPGYMNQVNRTVNVMSKLMKNEQFFIVSFQFVEEETIGSRKR